MNLSDNAEALLDVKALLAHLGISRQTYYRMKLRGEMVKEIRLSPRRIAYRTGDVSAWLQTRQAA